jgi:hypothetical protein
MFPQSAEQQNALVNLAGAKLGIEFHPPYVAVAIMETKNATLEGVVILNCYSNANIEISGVGQRCWTRPVLRALADYIYNGLRCARVTLTTRAGNRKARRFLGRHFKFETRLRRFYGDEDGLQYRMCRDECPWIGK